MKFDFKWISEVSTPYLWLFLGNIFLFYSIGNGLILENEDSNGIIGDTDGVVQLNNDFLIEFLILLVLSTLIFYLLIVKFRQNGLKILFGFSLLFIYISSFLEIFFYTSQSQLSLASKLILYLFAFFTGILGISFLYIFVKGSQNIPLRNFGLLISGLLAGRLIALYLDLQSLIAVSIILIIYDIWNVFQGPLTKLVGKPVRIDRLQTDLSSKQNTQHMVDQICKQGTPVYISTNHNLVTGLGDLFFFSALMYRSMIIWDFTGIILTFTTVLIGLFLTLKLLQFISPLPGLPIPVSLTLVLYYYLWNWG